MASPKKIQMKTIFGFQEVNEVVLNGYQEIGANACEAQRTIYRESKKKDCKSLFLIHQYVDDATFERIVGAKTTKEAWESLEKSYEGDAKIKKVKLQTMRRKYELLQMEENETVSNSFTKIHSLTNQMKYYGEEVKDQEVIEKILRTLTPKYDNIVVAIVESIDLECCPFGLHQNEKWRNCQGLMYEQGSSSQRSVNSNAHESDKRKCSNKNSTKCKLNKLIAKKEEEAELVQGGESDDGDHYLLMATVRNSEENVDLCKVKFVDHNVVSIEGISKMMIQRKDGKSAYISNVLYVPKMNNNMLSLGQLLEKGLYHGNEGWSLDLLSKDGMVTGIPQTRNFFVSHVATKSVKALKVL
ncbi:PREDICTED: uncharacterized protein LOC109326302 [Lupinus angustifolius]|uniref:uncharacterized protein LOC109326302 n=1 Tax=Lupinus angustifolius TaxID=3871 RepID=UPI00092F8E0A|nr:PREDICTED: uncharacterized protein LOC109326302 [Lupinus angustifolius]